MCQSQRGFSCKAGNIQRTLKSLSATLSHKCKLIGVTAAQCSANYAADDVIQHDSPSIAETCISEVSGFIAFWGYHACKD